MNIHFKKLHPDAVTPSKAHEHDAGFDLTAVTRRTDDNGCLVYETGIAVSIPPGFVGLVFPRSSIRKYGVRLVNSVGVIDSGYIGDITLTFARVTQAPSYEPGERVGQLVIVPIPAVELVEVDSLEETARGANGHGSTGA